MQPSLAATWQHIICVREGQGAHVYWALTGVKTHLHLCQGTPLLAAMVWLSSPLPSPPSVVKHWPAFTWEEANVKLQMKRGPKAHQLNRGWLESLGVHPAGICSCPGQHGPFARRAKSPKVCARTAWTSAPLLLFHQQGESAPDAFPTS